MLEQLLQLLDDVTLAMQQTVWVLYDGAPFHCSRNIMWYLDSQYTGRWIGQKKPDVWLSQSLISLLSTSTCGTI
jgi:hypothetical protein